MTPLVSALIPTRKRPDGLNRAISSLFSTANNPDQIEVVLKIDEDDSDTVENVATLQNRYGRRIKHVISPRGKGYPEMGRFVTEAESIATGQWSFLIDDDCWLEGKGWDDCLSILNPLKHLAQCEFYHLGGSKYGSGSCGPVGLFWPTGAWKQWGDTQITSPADDYILNTFVRDHGWGIMLLFGMVYRHNRDHEHNLKEHRKL